MEINKRIQTVRELERKGNILIRKYAQHIVLTAEDGTEYKGEFIDLRIDPATTPQGKYMIDYFKNLRRYNYEHIKRK